MLHVENMLAADFPFAVKLANTMDWNMNQEDFKLNLKLEREGCFVLFDRIDRAGIATCISFERVGWFGNLVVDEDRRNQGGGTILVQKAISYLRHKGVETIGLYAYQHLVRFYENIGFKSNQEFSVFQGKTDSHCIKSKLERITEKDVPEVTGFDKECFRGNRRKLLKPICLNENNQCYLAKHKGKITGYIMAKNYDKMIEVGPLICRRESNDVAKSLLGTVLSNSMGREVFVCLPTENNPLIGLLAEMGLKERFRVTRMFLGPAVAESCTYIAESLERG